MDPTFLVCSAKNWLYSCWYRSFKTPFSSSAKVNAFLRLYKTHKKKYVIVKSFWGLWWFSHDQGAAASKIFKAYSQQKELKRRRGEHLAITSFQGNSNAFNTGLERLKSKIPGDLLFLS